MSIPPGKLFCRTVLDPFCPRSTLCTLRRSRGQSRTIGSTRSFENFFASSSVGCTKSTVPGSWSMM